jgi:hypothetical protein
MMNKKVMASVLALSLAGLAVAAQAPQIDNARVDSMVKQVLQQAGQNPQMQGQVNGETIRAQVIKELQTVEVLKAEALKAGLDKDATVQNELKNLEAQFYAAKYSEHLEKTVQVDETEARRTYDAMAKMVQIQQVSFKTAAEAKEAQNLLLKGLSFADLMKRYPNEEQKFNQFVAPQQLPPPFATALGNMVRGDVTHEPVELNGQFYLIKLAAEQRNPEMPPFEQVKEQVLQQAKQQKVQEQIRKLLKDNGIE